MPQDYAKKTPHRGNKKKKKNTSKKVFPPLPGWGGILIGLALGLLTTVMVYFKPNTIAHLADKYDLPLPTPITSIASIDNIKTLSATSSNDSAAQATNDIKIKTTQVPPPQAPQFKFYTLLPEQQITVPGNTPPLVPKKALSILPATSSNKNKTEVPPSNTVIATQKNMPSTQRVNPPAIKKSPPHSHHYVLQAGAFSNKKNAEKLRGILALEHALSSFIHYKRSTTGKITYQVRIGPYQGLSNATHIKQQLEKKGININMIRQ